MKENSHLWDFPQFLSVIKNPQETHILQSCFFFWGELPSTLEKWGGRGAGRIEKPSRTKHQHLNGIYFNVQNTYSHLDSLGMILRTAHSSAGFPNPTHKVASSFAQPSTVSNQAYPRDCIFPPSHTVGLGDQGGGDPMGKEAISSPKS